MNSINEDIQYPVGRIENISVIDSCPGIPALSVKYTLLRIRNYKTEYDHDSQLWSASLQPNVPEDESAQPIIDADTVRPYNIAVWGDTKNRDPENEKGLVVFINANHYST
jgi:hypothetical protein